MKLMLATLVVLMVGCSTTKQPIASETTVSEARLIKAVPDWSTTSLGWLFYFDSYAPAYFPRQRLIVSIDDKVAQPIGRFQSDGLSLRSDCAECFLRVTFRSVEQLDQFLKMTSHGLRYYP